MLILYLLFCFQMQQTVAAPAAIYASEVDALSLPESDDESMDFGQPTSLAYQDTAQHSTQFTDLQRPAQPCCDRSYSYVFKIKIPAGIELCESLCGFYKGKPIDFEKNWAVWFEDEEQFTFSLIITPEVAFKTIGNNVRCVQRIKNQPFRWYDLTLSKNKNASSVWTIKQLDKKEAPLKIPDHTIILLLQPDCVEKLVKPVGCINQTTSVDMACVVALPTVVLRANVTEEELQEACIQAQIASLELRAIHQKPSAHVRKEQLAIIALCNKS